MLMGDDGVGPAAIGALTERGVGDRAELIDAGLAFSEVLCGLDSHRALVILDAVGGGGPAGRLYRLGLADLDPAPGSVPSAVSLHETHVLPALRMEALTGRAFTDVTIFGVQPGRLGWGTELSPPVAEGTERLIQAVCRYLDEYEASSPGEAPVASIGLRGGRE